MKKAIIMLLMICAGLALVDAAPVITSVAAQQHYPRNGKVDVGAISEGLSNDLDWNECAFAATKVKTKAVLPVLHVTYAEWQCFRNINC